MEFVKMMRILANQNLIFYSILLYSTDLSLKILFEAGCGGRSTKALES
jgi:hypothetical protein